MGLLNASVSVARPHSSESGKLRVLLISHTCRSASMGQPKARLLGQLPGINLRVLVPDRCRNDDGGRTPVDPPIDDSFKLEIGKVRWPFTKLFKRYYHHYPNLRKTIEDFQPHIIDIWEEPWGPGQCASLLSASPILSINQTHFRNRTESGPMVSAPL